MGSLSPWYWLIALPFYFGMLVLLVAIVRWLWRR